MPENNSSSSDAKMWIEKYRPHELTDLLSHTEIISTIQRLIDGGKLPHLLLYGPPGTGKTSTVLAIAKKLFGNRLTQNVLELNASDDRGIDVIRNEIKDFASTKGLKFFTAQKDTTPDIKLIILDEADQMTKDAQAALRRTIEKYSKNVRFCLICNYVNKIIPALQSRCTRFRFSPLKKHEVVSRLEEICKEENVIYNQVGLDAIYRLSNGDMRKCVNILQSTFMSFGQITEDNVHMCTGNPLKEDIRLIINSLFNDSLADAYKKVMNIKTERGLALQDILRDIHPYVMKLNIPIAVRIYLLEKMSDIEYRLSLGTSESLQTMALISAFQIAKEPVSSKNEEAALKLLTSEA
ncbi:predicted protein [Naegleria gruberi]|uniref:Predicted protein n=1 Tax=Naegleria gruberi TaxID=5762 RepID=D2UXA1_NAEGR|nr:uncharacterized protein NAEGRDRAFT_29498 [Naegleria gruberi]EFC50889.1 predicted protein [Naegleria gruberi]|eukprot:XP_002683633.1 predicted protein [Naegleria gruberi strain NEG-M]